MSSSSKTSSRQSLRLSKIEVSESNVLTSDIYDDTGSESSELSHYESSIHVPSHSGPEGNDSGQSSIHPECIEQNIHSKFYTHKSLIVTF